MTWVLTLIIGAAAGLMAAMGLGGGFVLLVYLLLCADAGQTQSQGTNLLFFLPVIALSVVLHLKNKLVDVKSALICGAFGAAAVFGGFAVANAADPELLRKLFAGFIIAAGLKDLFSKDKEGGAQKRQNSKQPGENN